MRNTVGPTDKSDKIGVGQTDDETTSDQMSGTVKYSTRRYSCTISFSYISQAFNSRISMKKLRFNNVF